MLGGGSCCFHACLTAHLTRLNMEHWGRVPSLMPCGLHLVFQRGWILTSPKGGHG